MTKKDIYDVFGIGFGPAGIALAAAIEDEEEFENTKWKKKFIDKQVDSTWMPQMLLPGTDIQHHYLRDFATPRNPRSKYTFPNYLQKKGRLFSFGLLNHPSRIEWSDYVKWVANQLSHDASYKTEALEVEIEETDRTKETLKIIAFNHDSNNEESYYTHNLVINSGRKPFIPSIFQPFLNDDIFHSSKFNTNISKILPRDEEHTFTVVGSGQNAIETILYISNKYPRAKINMVLRHTGFRLYDLGHFTNEVFFPEFTDYFVNLTKEKRANLFEQIKHTNYSAVDEDVSKELYWKMYEQEVENKNQIRLYRCSEVININNGDDGKYELSLQDIYSKDYSTIETDHLILCTGFVEEKIPSVLAPIKDYLVLDDNGELIVSKDYKVKTVNDFNIGIYLNGLTEKTHGIGDSASFTMMATKAQRILEKMNSSKAKNVVEVNN
ncbi:SidA/IucD/PvdA family monooxygenase [Halobacillus sp. B23F22_1]|uniref:SidA/IucD/PvdA family monooxygenase n=1 Tax=Halobacillus sp. B23F22_1 TaxID=3459514 RepID=UPI00373ECEA1